jgi:hypothetical protein
MPAFGDRAVVVQIRLELPLLTQRGHTVFTEFCLNLVSRAGRLQRSRRGPEVRSLVDWKDS